MKRGKRNNIFLRAGNWCVDFIIDGQRTRRSFGKDKCVAEAFLHELEKQRTLHRLGGVDGAQPRKIRKAIPEITFSELCETFFELRQECKQITLNSYRRIVTRHLDPVFGKKHLDQITPESIARLRNQLLKSETARRSGGNKRKPLKASTVAIILGVLRNILDEAVRLDYLSANPFRKLKPTRVEKSENKPLSLEQIKSVISCTRAQFQPILSFLAYTGCRPCEAYALKWKQVDFEKNEILIDAGRVFGIEGTPKTKAGRRVITMLPPVVTALKSLRGTASVVDMGRHVFLTQHGHPFNDNKPLNRAWTKALRKAGITHRRLYELRHSFASNMLAAGIPVTVVSRMIGHANPAATFAYYASDIEATRAQYFIKMAEVVQESRG